MMAAAQAWPNCDKDIKQFVDKLLEYLKCELGSKLTGIYLHGSLAMGSYYRPKSDVDLIVVVDRKLNADLGEAVGIGVANIAAGRPTIGNVELSVITAETAKRVAAPMPFEVHYSSGWHDKLLNREVDYSQTRTDPDLPSHLMYVTQRGVCLYGKPISEAFGLVEWDHFMEAVLDDLDWILADEHILETPFYSVLNICRVFQLKSENRRLVHSKEEGGQWGLAHFPQEYRPLIQQALDVYRSSEPVAEERRKTGGIDWNPADLLAFRDYARSRRRLP